MTRKSVPAPERVVAPSARAKAAVKTAAKAVAKPAVKPAAKAAAKAVAKPAVAPLKAPKTRARPVAKSAAKSAAKPAAAAKNAAMAVVKAAKGGAGAEARPALVRDSFTMPEGEYAVLAAVKQACLKAGVEVKKSELLRVGVALVGRLDMATLRQVLGSLPQLKTGRPPRN